jgi:hypothetical protein
MENYHDERTERWRKSERAEEFLQRIDDLRQVLDLITEWLADAT